LKEFREEIKERTLGKGTGIEPIMEQIIGRHKEEEEVVEKMVEVEG